MSWHASLDLAYAVEAGRTVARHRHTGPLRILQSLYPEGDTVCHNVLVHPPGGLVGGDTLDIHVHAASGTHGLITTPGATRFYRSQGERAVQQSRITLEPGARLEWLPLENIAYSGCLAENRLQLNLEEGAELIGWDVTALGLPNAGLPFDTGRFSQHIEMPDVWLERGHMDATDLRLMNSPLGLAGNRCMASLFFATGTPIERQRKQQVLNVARDIMATHDLRSTAGATSPNPQVVVLRAIAPLVESAMDAMRQVWTAWRSLLWNQPASSPRIWST